MLLHSHSNKNLIFKGCLLELIFFGDHVAGYQYSFNWKKMTILLRNDNYHISHGAQWVFHDS